MKLEAVTEFEEEIKAITEEYEVSAKELNCDKDDIVKIFDFGGFLPSENSLDFEELYNSVLFENFNLVEKLETINCEIREIRGHKYVQNTTEWYMLWEGKELLKYLNEIRGEVHEDYPLKTIRYFYGLFIKVGESQFVRDMMKQLNISKIEDLIN